MYKWLREWAVEFLSTQYIFKTWSEFALGKKKIQLDFKGKFTDYTLSLLTLWFFSASYTFFPIVMYARIRGDMIYFPGKVR